MSFSLARDFDSLEEYLDARAPHQPEFHQAVTGVIRDIKPIIDHNPAYREGRLFEQLCEPDRVITFRVTWQNDAGEIEVNRGYRVQFNGAIGPYKGGIRFHPSVNLSVLKFLGFEQCFKNALTGMPMGGAKGGADFDPAGRSDEDIRRFCSAFMQELHRHIGPDTDIPAGDINVGQREIGYLFGAYRRITNQFHGVLTGKGTSFGGSRLRVEATGYGVMYFLCNMMQITDNDLEGRTILVSGAGNVATHTAEKACEMGAKVITLSDRTGMLHDPEGLTSAKLKQVRELKQQPGATLEACAKEFGAEWHSGATPWDLDADIAIPCATQNELDGKHASRLVSNGITAVVEGANMPCTPEAQQVFRDKGILFAPGMAANAGGVAISGLEISQNRHRRSMGRDQVDQELQTIMACIHEACVEDGKSNETIDYAKGAHIAAFRKLADAMLAQGPG